MIMTRHITELGKREVEFLSTLASQGREIFTIDDARKYWGAPHTTRKRLAHLEKKGWLERLERGKYLIIPLEAGPERSWSEHALVIAAHLLKTSAVAYWSALHYWRLTEQAPQVVFVQSTSRKFAAEKQVLGVTYRFITVVERKFFGRQQERIDHKVFFVTDKEKTLLDCLDRPDLAGGLVEVVKALRTSASEFDWDHIDAYAKRFNVGAVLKRLGFLIEELGVAIPDRHERLSRWSSGITAGISKLDPSTPRKEHRIDTRWRVRVNLDERLFSSSS